MSQKPIPQNIMTRSGLILKEGSTRSYGRDALRSNISACLVVAESVKSSLGPKGMDKMLVDGFGDVTITNDGATILDEMDVQHPAAKMIVEVAKTQDDEVGDGTTTAAVLAGELLRRAQGLTDLGIHPSAIVDGYQKAQAMAIRFLQDIAIKVEPTDKSVLKKVAKVSLVSKLIADEKDYIADLAVKAVLHVAGKSRGGYKVDTDDIKVEKKEGGALSDTTLVQGVLLDKEIVHAGMPKRVEKAKIVLLSCPLEVEKTEFDAKLNVDNPDQMKAFLDEENKIMEGMVDKILSAGANVVVCEKGIDDLVQHYLAKNGILAVRRVKQSDMEKMAKATGAAIVNTLEDLSADDLGYAEVVEERKVSDDKMTFVEGCKDAKSVSILVRGGTERVVDEAERAIHDALSVVGDVVIDPRIVAGGGAPEVEIARLIKNEAGKLSGVEQLAVQAYAESIESIPLILAENAGMDPISTIVAVRSKHAAKKRWFGVDPIKAKIADMAKSKVYEPLSVKLQAFKSASEAAAVILRIDDVIAASKQVKESGKGPKESAKEEGEGEP